MDEVVEYEMDEQDIIFVTQTLPGLKIQIAEEKFEKIVDRLEKESFKLVRHGLPIIASYSFQRAAFMAYARPAHCCHHTGFGLKFSS